ncbi:MAG: hypothetical protein ACE5PM_08115 [Candidatus Hydrothermarchaeales archaeon]
MESAEELLEKLLQRYNKNPQGWNFLIGKGHEDRFFDILISHGRETWQIKLDTLYKPNPIGLGAKVGRIEGKILRNPHPFGFRPLSEDLVGDLLRSGLSSGIIEEILESKPVPIDKIKTPAVAQGPIRYSGLPPSLRPLDFVSEEHKKLDLKLGEELDKLLRKSGYMTPYL